MAVYLKEASVKQNSHTRFWSTLTKELQTENIKTIVGCAWPGQECKECLNLPKASLVAIYQALDR